MKKTYYFFTVFVLIIILAFIITKKDKSLEENIIKYNPKNPTLIFEGHNLNKFLKEIKNNSNVFKEITKNKKINNITNHLFLIDSIIQSENRFSISLYNNAKKANIFMVFNIEETHKHDIKDILQETLDHERDAISMYYKLLEAVQDQSVYLEEFARSMIGQEELHVLEVEKMLKEHN